MSRSPQFHLLGVPVRVEAWFFLVIGGLGYLIWPDDPVLLATWVVLAFSSVLLHEMGHAVAFRTYGHRPSILLYGFGGLTSARGLLSPRRSIVVSLAGPLAALVLFGLPAWALFAAGVGDGSELWRGVLVQAIFVNVGWSLLNLVPILPLDGGNVAASALELVAPRRGRRLAAGLSVVVAGGLAAVTLVYGLVIAAVICGFFAVTNLRDLRAADQEGSPTDDAVRALLSGDPAGAEVRARAALREAGDPGERTWAAELLAWAALQRGDPAAARSLLRADGDGVGTRGSGDRLRAPGAPPAVASASLQAAAALASGRTAEGVAVLAWALTREPRVESRVLGVLAAVRHGVIGDVIDELLQLDDVDGRAVAEGVRDVLEQVGHADGAAAVAARLGRPSPGAGASS